MVPELGLFLLITALMASALSLGFGWMQAETVQVRALRLANLLVFSSLLLLAYSFYKVDLSVQIVYQHADYALPVLYRIGAVWGGHEGSILLWVTILNAWVFASTWLKLPCEIRNNMFKVLAIFNLGFLLFILTVSNPFARYLPIQPSMGQDLNPFLQDPVMLIHPPILYLGYLGFAIPFALAVAVLWLGRFEATAVKVIDSCVLVAWSFLTVGIVLGSFWAYYELGWGGWWFWDPVENASLMPWLAGGALLHILRMVKTRQAFQGWALLLCLLAFTLSILGTFLVRSGALTSVHSFANDPKRGLFILGLLTVFCLPALILFSVRAGKFYHGISFKLTSREGLILINNVILTIILATVLLGTLYPLAIESLGLGFISVGAPYFNALVVPLGLIMLALLPLATIRMRLSWRLIGMHCAHLGFAVFVAGAALTTFMSKEEDVILGVGDSHRIGAYEFTLEYLRPIQGPNYEGTRAKIRVTEHDKFLTDLKPEKRLYNQNNLPIAEIALDGSLSRDLYLALAEPLEHNQWIVRIQIKPWVRLIWLGGLMMAAGGILSLVRRS